MSAIKMNYLHPDDALIQLPPAPPRDILPLSRRALMTQDEGPKPTFLPRPAAGREKTLCTILHELALDLHWCHRERIPWPVEESLKPSTYVQNIKMISFHASSLPDSINLYHRDVLVAPVLHIFNQLHADFITRPVQCKLEVTNEGEGVTTFSNNVCSVPQTMATGESIVSFHSDDFELWDEPVNTPIVVFEVNIF